MDVLNSKGKSLFQLDKYYCKLMLFWFKKYNLWGGDVFQYDCIKNNGQIIHFFFGQSINRCVISD